MEKLSDFETRINYLESETEKDVLLNTSPKGNSLVYYGQTIILNVSLGYESEKYRDLTNTLYNDNLEYIDYLKNEYQVRIDNYHARFYWVLLSGGFGVCSKARNRSKVLFY